MKVVIVTVVIVTVVTLAVVTVVIVTSFRKTTWHLNKQWVVSGAAESKTNPKIPKLKTVEKVKQV